MAKWNTGNDVLSDLDRLSEFTSGKKIRTRPVKNISSRPPYNLFARGAPIKNYHSSEVTNSFEDDEVWHSFAPGNEFQQSIGRGQMLQTTSQMFELKRSHELQRQLREACGSGFSNELIESQFGHRYKSSESESELYQDVGESSETADLSMSDKSNISNTCSSSAVCTFSQMGTPTTSDKTSDSEMMRIVDSKQVEDPGESVIISSVSESSISSAQSSVEPGLSNITISSKPSSNEGLRKLSTRTCKLRNKNALLNSLATKVTLSQTAANVPSTQEFCALHVDSNTEVLPETYSNKRNSLNRISNKMSPNASEFIQIQKDSVHFSVDNNIVYPSRSFLFDELHSSQQYVFKPSINYSGFQYNLEEFPPLCLDTKYRGKEKDKQKSE